MKTKALTGVILYSTNPERLAQFYIQVIGIPFQLETHGKIKEHYECLFNNIHFAILKRGQADAGNTVVPSFRVDDLTEFVEHHQLKTLHPFIELGEGKRVTSISDVDGNVIRLIQVNF